MSERVQLKAWVPKPLKDRLERFLIEEYGQVHGNQSEAVEEAVHEYLDHDRYARIEERLDRIEGHLTELTDAHTHKASESSAKVERIAESIAREGRTVIPKDTVRRAIEDVAGADDRTVRKYRDLLKRWELAYKHPTDGVWTQDRDEWIRWVVEYVNNNPTVTRTDVIEDYPIGYDELDRLATEVVEA